MLEQYLEYYLARPDLRFDQDFAMAALGYLDEKNGTICRARFDSQWQRFVATATSWDLSRADEIFRSTMHTIESAAQEDA